MEIKATLNKPYTDTQRLDFIVKNNHQKGYEIKETEEALEAWGYTDAEKLVEAKQAKVQENDTARDTALNAGVVYKDVLFDSDTDQKVNLLATVNMMSDEDTITWFGKDNQPLECTKEDLLNIGNLIIQLHSFCWNKNALIKNEIAEASTYAELDAIEINYELLADEDINGSNGGEQAS